MKKLITLMIEVFDLDTVIMGLFVVGSIAILWLLCFEAGCK